MCCPRVVPRKRCSDNMQKFYTHKEKEHPCHSVILIKLLCNIFLNKSSKRIQMCTFLALMRQLKEMRLNSINWNVWTYSHLSIDRIHFFMVYRAFQFNTKLKTLKGVNSHLFGIHIHVILFYLTLLETIAS